MFLCVLMMSSCKFFTSEDVLLENTEKLLNSQITLYEDSVFTSDELKLLIFIPDTSDCASCRMMIYHWRMYKEDLSTRGIDCNFIYILNDSLYLDENTTALVNSCDMLYSNGLKKMYELNDDIPLETFDAYLVDCNNKIRLVGNPVQNIDLWGLYRNKMKELINK